MVDFVVSFGVKIHSPESSFLLWLLLLSASLLFVSNKQENLLPEQPKQAVGRTFKNMIRLTFWGWLLWPLVAARLAGAFVPLGGMPSRHTTTTTTTLEGILGRFRKKQEVIPSIPEPITVGSPIPAVDVEMLRLSTDDKDDDRIVVTSEPVTADEILATSSPDGKAILVGMPGAFTPTCSSQHLPGLIASATRLRQLGVEKIAVVTTNDRFVNEEWGRMQGLFAASQVADDNDDNSKCPIIMLSDGDAALVKELGMVQDMGFGVGLRSKRFALVLENGLVTRVLTDDEGMDSCELTSATNLIQLLTPEEDQAMAVSDDGLGVPALAAVGAGVVLLGLALVVMGGGGGSDHSTVQTVMPTASGAGSGAEFTLLNTFGK